MPFKKSKLIPNLKNKITRRRAADSTKVRQGEITQLGYFLSLVLFAAAAQRGRVGRAGACGENQRAFVCRIPKIAVLR